MVSFRTFLSHVLYFFRCISRFQSRQYNRKDTSFARFALQFNRTVMQFYQTLHQRQTDSTTYMFLIHLIKTFKNQPLFFYRNACSCILHFQQKITRCFTGPKHDTITGRSVFEGIRQQIIQNQFNVFFITPHVSPFQIRIQPIIYLFGFCQSGIYLIYVLKHRMQHNLFYLQTKDSQLSPAVIHQLIDQVQQPVGAVTDIFQLRQDFLVCDFSYHLLQRSYNKSQRSTQLMRYIDKKAKLHFIHLLHPFFVKTFHLQLHPHAFTNP